MKNTGYSGKSLIQKLGYKTDETLFAIRMPDDIATYLQKEGIPITSKQPSVWVHGFFKNTDQLKDFLTFIALDEIEKGLWVSWPKKSSGVLSDLSEQTFRDYILPLGWVDTKVCAIDQTWSGLKFLKRKV